MAPRFHRLRISALRRETADAVSLSFTVPDALREAYRFTPGQHLTLRAAIDGEDVRRSYSICSAPDDEELRVAIKRVEGGAFSAWANAALAVGDELSVMTPDGRFGVPIEPRAARLLVGLAAGSGITPILSILKTVLLHEPGSRFCLFYGNRSTDSIMFRGELEDLKDRYLSRLSVFHVLSREQQDVPVLNGHLDAEKVGRLMRTMLPVAAVDHAFVCGPQPMIEGLEKALADVGLPRERIHVERFTPAAGGRPRVVVVQPAGAPKAIAVVISEGVRTEIPVAEGEAIIDAAIRAGRNLPYSCKGGMCCTCRARLLEGRVEMTVNYSLEPWETEAGYVLTCQSHPLTERVVVDYDQV
jgi:ring-1,2-phenylacetyl-CoA epoxidase subunit PaaE